MRVINVSYWEQKKGYIVSALEEKKAFSGKPYYTTRFVPVDKGMDEVNKVSELLKTAPLEEPHRRSK